MADINELAEKIIDLDEEYQKLTDNELRNKTDEFKKRLADGEDLEKLWRNRLLSVPNCRREFGEVFLGLFKRFCSPRNCFRRGVVLFLGTIPFIVEFDFCCVACHLSPLLS